MPADLSRLPELCYSAHLENGDTVILKRGERGYYDPGYGHQGEDAIGRLNDRLGVTRAQRSAMEAGSVLGFNSPAANPDMYDATGARIRGRKLS